MKNTPHTNDRPTFLSASRLALNSGHSEKLGPWAPRMGDGTMKKVKEIIQRYSSRRTPFSDEKLLSDIDTLEVDIPEEAIAKVAKCLKSSLDVTKVLMEKNAKVTDEKVLECIVTLDSLRRNIEGLRRRPNGNTLAWIALGISGVVGLFYISR